jgi:hypothetical protein
LEEITPAAGPEPAFLFVLHPIWKRPTDILAHARKCQIQLAFNPVGISSYKRGCPNPFIYCTYVNTRGVYPRTEEKAQGLNLRQIQLSNWLRN